MRKVSQICAILAAQVLLLPAAYAQTRDIGVHGEMLDRIAAIVNDGLVLKSELDSQMDSVTKRLVEQKKSSCPRKACSSSKCSTVWSCRKFRCSVRSTSD